MAAPGDGLNTGRRQTSITKKGHFTRGNDREAKPTYWKENKRNRRVSRDSQGGQSNTVMKGKGGGHGCLKSPKTISSDEK